MPSHCVPQLIDVSLAHNTCVLDIALCIPMGGFCITCMCGGVATCASMSNYFCHCEVICWLVTSLKPACHAGLWQASYHPVQRLSSACLKPVIKKEVILFMSCYTGFLW